VIKTCTSGLGLNRYYQQSKLRSHKNASSFKIYQNSVSQSGQNHPLGGNFNEERDEKIKGGNRG